MGGLCRLVVNQKMIYPAYLSLTAGETLQAIIRREGNLKRIENLLDAKSFTQKFLETLLLNYEDDKLDNLGVVRFISLDGKFVYRLISLDSDSALDTALEGQT